MALWSDRIQDLFKSNLTGSSAAVFAMAVYLHKHGLDVEIPHVEVSQRAEDNIFYEDSGDLFIVNDGPRKRLEVKGLLKPSYHFTCAEDFRMPHLFFSNARKMERTRGLVHRYVVVNPKLTHAFVVHPDTSEHWYTDTRAVSNAETPETNWCCKKPYVEFIKL